MLGTAIPTENSIWSGSQAKLAHVRYILWAICFDSWRFSPATDFALREIKKNHIVWLPTRRFMATIVWLGLTTLALPYNMSSDEL